MPDTNDIGECCSLIRTLFQSGRNQDTSNIEKWSA